LILEDEGIMVLQIVGNHSTSNATLYPRRPESSESPQWKPQIKNYTYY